ncbi:hypothetical protein [Gluconobacter sp. Gdi]|uniref:hypothetical protein n=1 Tax=Gluconobacter sp. Gdi TaxID=2691888 RepID=UPI00176FB771|nr:hypothetical protein [Gluconobacter sp. Gdi]GFE98171.1 hypothetical protein DmGdi_32440 [Gluconobacter sp. Gdi]
MRRSSAQKWSDVVVKQIDLHVSQFMTGPELHAVVADQCREARDDLIASGSASPVFQTRVDGDPDRPEEQARLDGGVVTYVFSSVAQATNWALTECRKRSPVRSGDFRKSWAVLVDGVLWSDAPAKIPAGSAVWIVNTMPYARKIEVGGMKVRTDPQIIEGVRQATLRRFQTVQAERAFKPLTGGRDARGGPVPYVLKNAGVASGLSWKKKTGWSRKHRAYTSRRSDRQAGQTMLYPTLILTERMT